MAKVQGSVSPDPIWIQYIDNGMANVRLRRDIASVSKTDNVSGNTYTIFEYDEVIIQIVDRDSLETWVNNNFNNLFDNAIQTAKDNKINELNQMCTNAICEGFYSSALGISHFYRFNLEEDQLNFNQKFSQMINDTTITTINWKTQDAGILPHTRDQFTQVIKDAANHKESLISKYWDVKNQVNSCTSKADIDDIYWS